MSCKKHGKKAKFYFKTSARKVKWTKPLKALPLGVVINFVTPARVDPDV